MQGHSAEGNRILVARTSCPRVPRASGPQNIGKDAAKMPAVLADRMSAPRHKAALRLPWHSSRQVFFGGTFDPVHNGHLIVARDIAEKLGLERITLVPAARSPHKRGAAASAADRLEMLRLAVRGEKVFVISEIEIHQGGPSYTVDTIRKLRQQQGLEEPLAWVVGADVLEDLPKWHNIQELLSLADLVVAVRPPWHLRLDALFNGLERDLGPQQVNKLRKSVIATPTVEISSTEIRSRVAAGSSIRYLVPEAVERHIRTNRLYAPEREP